uniref:Transmembrane protein 199 n=1 Tax=Caenorhabditis tropicalis TaxID=1561998 RepID=A0A1I7TSZ8_9PELO
MAQWNVSEGDKDLLRNLVSRSKQKITPEVTKSCKEFYKKDVVSYEDLVNIKTKLPDDIPVFVFFDRLTLKHEDHTYHASEEFRKKTEQLKIQQEQDSYKRLIRDIDPAQKYGRTDHMENFGTEMRAVNRQMISVINVVITVVGAFFFGFSGVTYAYPHLKLDLPTRFIIGLVPATIVFFCDLYFVIKGMDMDETTGTQTNEPGNVQPHSPATFSFKNMEAKKND